MASQWYCIKAGRSERHGPFSDSDLKRLVRAGKLVAEDLVWREGMSSPAPAAKVKGLFETKTQAPPAPSSPSPPESSSSEPSGNTFGFSASPPPDLFDVASIAANTVTFAGGAAPELPDAEPRGVRSGKDDDDDPSRGTGVWAEAPYPFQGPTWKALWRLIDAAAAQSKAVYFIVPLLAAVPVGLLFGIFDAVNPIVIISILLIFVAGLVLGLLVFEAFRRTGIHSKLLSRSFGFLVSLVTAYFFFVGGLQVERDRMAPPGVPPMSAGAAFLPPRIVAYVQWKAKTMVVRKSTQMHGASPDPVGNYLWIGIMSGTILLTVTAGAGGPEVVGRKESEDDPDAPYVALLNKHS